MPIYEYQCEDCSYRFEVKQSIKDDPISTCERCGKSVRRLISSPGIMFKGSGWYVTDYSNKLKPSEGEKSTSADGQKKEAPAESTATSSSPASSASTATSGPSSSSTPTSTSSTTNSSSK